MENLQIVRNQADAARFNHSAKLPFQLRLKDFELAMQDVYDFFYDVNLLLVGKGLQRLDDMLRPAIMSGLLSDMLTASLARHSRTLVQNRYFNGHPDLVVRGVYPSDSIKAGSDGLEIKTTRKSGGAVDTHGARDQWMCVFVYAIDNATETSGEPPAHDLHGGLSRPSDGRRLPSKPARTARDENSNLGPRRDRKVEKELGVSLE